VKGSHQDFFYDHSSLVNSSRTSAQKIRTRTSLDLFYFYKFIYPMAARPSLTSPSLHLYLWFLDRQLLVPRRVVGNLSIKWSFRREPTKIFRELLVPRRWKYFLVLPALSLNLSMVLSVGEALDLGSLNRR
jgi:hypothetical protein